MRGSIVYRIGLVVTALTVGQAVMFFALGLSAQYVRGRMFRLRLVDQGVALARLATAPRLSGASGCSHLGDLSWIEGFAVVCYDSQGRRVATSREDVRAEEALPPGLLSEARQLRGKPVLLREPGRGEGLAAIAWVPAPAGAEPVEGSFVGVFDVGTRAYVASGVVVGLAAQVTGATVLTALLTAVLARWARRRLGGLERVMDRMADGHLDERLPVVGPDELARVAGSFNRMADALASTIAALREAEARRIRLFAAFTHEIATPLTSVMGYLESLRDPLVDSDAETRRRYVEVAHAQALALDVLGEDLATLSRLDLGDLQLTCAPTDLGALARAEVLPFEERGGARAVRFQVLAPGPLQASIDANRVRQVLRALLDNALRHAPDGSTVRVEVTREAQAVVVRVMDEGSGVPVEELPRLGEPLYRGDPSRSHRTGGRGLGLSIAAGIARAHGGTLRFESPPGSGLVVTLALPAV